MNKLLISRVLLCATFFISILFFAHTTFAGDGGGLKAKITFASNYTQINEGQSVRLSWLVDNGLDIVCIAGGGWLGTKTPVNIETLSPKVGLTYTLSCRGSNNTATTTKSIFVDVIKSNPSPIRAFPGAEGFGAYTPGGRGGRVIEVTNLEDSGPGSFRDAVTATGARIVVFRVAGTIETCKGNSGPIWINNPYLTIAGQTAPGDGVTLKLSPTCASTNIPVLGINTHDVIVRHLRIRPGKPPAIGAEGDAINLPGNAYNIILDHLSLSWASDENFNVSRGGHDITMQWSILSEPLMIGSIDYGYGALIADDPGFTGTGNISMHHNLFAHTNYRNPNINIAGVADIVNNVIYNYKTGGVRVWDIYQEPARVNVIGNYAIAGPSTTVPLREITTQHSVGYEPISVYVKDNIGPRRPTTNLPESTSVTCLNRVDLPVSYSDCPETTYLSATPFSTPLITTTDAATAYTQVLASAGARPTGRDPVDARIVSNVQNRSGFTIQNPNEVGGWPILFAGIAPNDTDHDGMPDTWETSNSFNINNATDGNLDADNDGYTNIEEFLNSTNPRIAQVAYFPEVAYSNAIPQTAQANLANEEVLRKNLVYLTTLVLLLSLVVIYKVRKLKESR
jgi:pectate lyase